MILDTRWFIRAPAARGPGIVYTRPMRNAQGAWNAAALAMLGGTAYINAGDRRTELLDKTKRSMRAQGYRAVRCHISEA